MKERVRPNAGSGKAVTSTEAREEAEAQNDDDLVVDEASNEKMDVDAEKENDGMDQGSVLDEADVDDADEDEDDEDDEGETVDDDATED